MVFKLSPKARKVCQAERRGQRHQGAGTFQELRCQSGQSSHLSESRVSSQRNPAGSKSQSSKNQRAVRLLSEEGHSMVCHIRGRVFLPHSARGLEALSQISAGHSRCPVSAACSRGTNRPTCPALSGFSGHGIFSAKAILGKSSWCGPRTLAECRVDWSCPGLNVLLTPPDGLNPTGTLLCCLPTPWFKICTCPVG